MKHQEIFHYIIDFLTPDVLGINGQVIGYEYNSSSSDALVVILRSTFFEDDVYGTSASIPSLPLPEIEGTPVLFGEPIIEVNNGKVLIHADLVASTFFLISRYEETINNKRDKHGRLPGKNSLPFRAGFIYRPIVEEYRSIITNCLQKIGVKTKVKTDNFSDILFTHDVDVPWTYFSLGGAIRRELGALRHEHRLVAYPFMNLIGNPKHDPKYTFEILNAADKMVAQAKRIYFVKSGGNKAPEDATPYIHDKGFKKLLNFFKQNNAILGYHVSYEAGEDNRKIRKELATLRQVTGKEITISRNHYLASREPSDYQALIENGIEDDYTMGYADVAGFRLGTCRPVRWIDPVNIKLTDLVLHPLTIMDVTLSDAQYMGMSGEEAQKYGDELINQVYKYGGELVFLWHNSERIGNTNFDIWNNYLHFIETIKSLEY